MVRKLVSILLVALLITPQFSFSQEQKFYTIAVLDLVANGISETETKSLSEFMRGQVTRIATSGDFRNKSGYAYKVIERSQMDKILNEMQFQRSGCTDEECAVEVGKVLGAERVIIGSVGLVGETYNINTRIVDIESSTTLSVADYIFTGKRDNLLTTGIPNVVNELLYGKKQKKSKKMYYIVGGIVLAGGAAAAILGGSGGGSSGGGEGTAIIDIVLDE